MGYLLLGGGAEFGGRMAIPDKRAMDLAGGLDARLSIIPAAAAPDNNHERAGRNGAYWFQNLGATRVAVLSLIDRESADHPEIVTSLKQSKLIYLLGGFPHHLGQSLAGSIGWQAILEAYRAGAVIAGSSAGAMVLCEYYYHPADDNVVKGLGLVPGVCVVPHHNDFGQRWIGRLEQLIPGVVLAGIDEETGMINDAQDGHWQVYGKGQVTLHQGSQVESYGPGTPFDLYG